MALACRTKLLGLAVVCVLACPVARAHADSAPAIEQLLAKAKASNSRVLLAFRAEWCQPCRFFETKLHPTPVVLAALRKFTFVTYDIETPIGRLAADRFGVGALPTFIALDASGVERLRQTGLGDRTPEGFAKFLARAADATASLAELEKRLAQSSDETTELLRMARWYRQRNNVDGALRFYARILAKTERDPQLLATAAWESQLLQRAEKRVQGVVADAVAYVRSYPGTELAMKALTRAVLSGRLPLSKRAELIALHGAVIGNDEDRVYELTVVALAAGTFDEALQLARRYKVLGQNRFRTYLLLGVVRLFRGDNRGAKAMQPILKAWAANGGDRLLLRDFQRRVRQDERSSGAVTAIRLKTAAYFEALRAPEQARPNASNTDLPFHRAYVRFQEASRDALRWTGRRCAKESGGLREVWVHLKLGGHLRSPKQVLILEPRAGARLRRCIAKALSTRRLPAAHWLPDDRMTARIRLPRIRQALPGVPPPALPSQRYLLLRGAAGIDRNVGAGVLFDVAGWRLADFFGSAMLDAHIGAAEAGRAVYSISLLGGLAFARDSVRVGLQGGVGVSKPGASIEQGIELPVQLVVSLTGEKVRGLAWIRSSWLLSADTRKRGSSHAAQGSDELRLGLGVRLPGIGGRDLFLGTTMLQAVEKTEYAILVGTTIR